MKNYKIFFLLCFLLLARNTHAQINIKDSLVENTAYWMLNDEVTYDVYYKNYRIIENDTLTILDKKNMVTVKVTDSTNISYDIEWTYHKIEPPKSKATNFKIKFQTDEYGSFKKWMNKEEVLQELKNDNYPDFIQAEKKFIELLVNTSKLNAIDEIYKVLENYLLIDIFLYHYFYGGSYEMNKLSWGTIEVDNPINKKKMESSVIVEVDYFDIESETYILSSTTQPNQKDLNTFLKDFIKINDDNSSFYNEIKNRTLFHNSGWLIQNEIQNKMSFKNEIIIKNSRFEMRD